VLVCGWTAGGEELGGRDLLASAPVIREVNYGIRA